MAFKLFIDRGHGGNDPGAVNNTLKLHEADIVYDIGTYLAEAMKDYEDVETKFGPRPVGKDGNERLLPRAVEANNWKADFLVSLHINAGGGTGSETLHYTEGSATSKKAASVINTKVASVFKAKGMKDRGVKPQNVLVLRKSNMPAVLVEYGFIDNAIDVKYLQQKSFLKEVAVATAEGIAEMFNLKKKVKAPVNTDVKRTEITIVWEGKALSSKGLNEAGRTYVPARALGELGGNTIGYKNGKVTINGIAIDDTINVNGTGYIRSTALANAIGYVAIWGSKEQTVYFNKKD